MRVSIKIPSDFVSMCEVTCKSIICKYNNGHLGDSYTCNLKRITIDEIGRCSNFEDTRREQK